MTINIIDGAGGINNELPKQESTYLNSLID